MKSELINNSNINDEKVKVLIKIIETIESRENLLKDVNVSNLSNILQASLISKLTTTLIKTLKLHIDIITDKFKNIEAKLVNQEETMGQIIDGIKLTLTNQNNFNNENLILENFTHISEKLNPIIDSLSTKEDLNSFYDEYKKLFENTFKNIIKNISENYYLNNNNNSDSNNTILQVIEEHFITLENLMKNN